jgi:serine phosphatase RsbU (regulator of sigma subunit)
MGFAVPSSDRAVTDTSADRHGDDLLRFLETMPAAFCFLDAQWRFRYVNSEAQRLMGRPRDAIVGHSLWNIFPPAVGGALEASCRSAVATGAPMTFEASLPGAPDGWFEMRVCPGAEGVVVYVVDVTDRRDAAEVARRAVARSTLLARVSAGLADEADPESALAHLARLVVPALTDGCIVTVVDAEGRARDVGSWHADPARRPLMAEYAGLRLETLPSTSPVARGLQAGIRVTESVDAVLALMAPGPARDLLRAIAPATATVLPLSAEGRTVGVLTLYQDAGRLISADDLDTAAQVTAEAAQAVARVHRQSQQAQRAEILQRSLLTDLPDLGGTTAVVRYVPAMAAARVGGDWYDAFLQRDGNPVVVIGDVVGHDTAAAAAMGQLRGLLRGIAHYSGAGPAEVLRGLDEAIAHMHPETLATAAVARLERPRKGSPGWRLRWANAGHPPPVVLGSDGTVTLLGGGLGDLLLGMDATAVRSESVVDLPPDATVVLYTDGLIERRGSTLDEGMARLSTALHDVAGRPLDEICDSLLARMLDGRPQDDVALLAVRAPPASA